MALTSIMHLESTVYDRDVLDSASDVELDLQQQQQQQHGLVYQGCCNDEDLAFEVIQLPYLPCYPRRVAAMQLDPA